MPDDWRDGVGVGGGWAGVWSQGDEKLFLKSYESGLSVAKIGACFTL